MEGIARIEARIGEISERMEQLSRFNPVSSGGVGWAPGLAGSGTPYDLYANGTTGQAVYGASSVDNSFTAAGLNSSFADVAEQVSSSDWWRTDVDGTRPIATTFDAAAVGAARTPAPAFVPPTELTTYGNGRIPSDALEPIGVGKHRLWGPAAVAFRQMALDAASDGVNIGVTDSYRSFDQQVELAGRKGLYSEGGLAAQPGTSKHGWGVAIDADVDARGLAWMRANASRYGFYETTPREPWHWEYRTG